MNIAFVDGSGKRVMMVDVGDEVDTPTKMPIRVCAFINLMCDSLGWSWEPVKQPRTNSRILSYKELQDAINGQV